ncbi:MAG: hypothetical protein KC420_19590, partial [Myxococcales bacterium]|nr:hypothetical protein [Myxococcales bacterium]
MTRRSTTPLLALTLLSACVDDHPDVVTEHLDIVLHDHDRLCQGSRDDFDKQVQRVADVLGIELRTRLLLHFGYSMID